MGLSLVAVSEIALPDCGVWASHHDGFLLGMDSRPRGLLGSGCRLDGRGAGLGYLEACGIFMR